MYRRVLCNPHPSKAERPAARLPGPARLTVGTVPRFSTSYWSATNDRWGSVSGVMVMEIAGLYAAMYVLKIASAAAIVAAVRAATPTGPHNLDALTLGQSPSEIRRGRGLGCRLHRPYKRGQRNERVVSSRYRVRRGLPRAIGRPGHRPIR